MEEVRVRVLDLSTIGARIEHEQRFPLQAPRLRLQWHGSEIALPFRVARSQIIARSQSGLLYQSGIQFTAADEAAESVITSMLQWAAQPESAPPGAAPPQPARAVPLEDTWTRQVEFLRFDLGDDLPYAQFRLGERGWVKEYVSSPAQPVDGFTIARDETDIVELQRTFECADPETRRMMRIALESKLGIARFRPERVP